MKKVNASRTTATEKLTGFRLMENFIGHTEERLLINFLSKIRYKRVDIGGTRDLRFYGYDPLAKLDTNRIIKTTPIPKQLLALTAKCQQLAKRTFDQVLVTRYGPGDMIDWHRDVLHEPVVAAISLGSSCKLKFRLETDHNTAISIELPPRSLYIMKEQAWADWEHSVPAVDRLRFSITWRAVPAHSISTSYN